MELGITGGIEGYQGSAERGGRGAVPGPGALSAATAPLALSTAFWRSAKWLTDPLAEVRVKDVINTQDVSEFRALAGGVTAARLLHGSANVVGGQDAVVKLKYGRTASEQVIADAPQGVKFALGENVKFRTTRFPNTRMGVEATLNRAFLEASDYRRRWQQYRRRLMHYRKWTSIEISNLSCRVGSALEPMLLNVSRWVLMRFRSEPQP